MNLIKYEIVSFDGNRSVNVPVKDTVSSARKVLVEPLIYKYECVIDGKSADIRCFITRSTFSRLFGLRGDKVITRINIILDRRVVAEYNFDIRRSSNSLGYFIHKYLETLDSVEFKWVNPEPSELIERRCI